MEALVTTSTAATAGAGGDVTLHLAHHLPIAHTNYLRGLATLLTPLHTTQALHYHIQVSSCRVSSCGKVAAGK